MYIKKYISETVYAQVKQNPYLTVKMFMYGGRHTVIVLCCLVGHKTIVHISKKNHCSIPKATCCPKHLVLPGTGQKWPVPEDNPKCMLNRDADLSHPGVPSVLHCCQLPNLDVRAHKNGTHCVC